MKLFLQTTKKSPAVIPNVNHKDEQPTLWDSILPQVCQKSIVRTVKKLKIRYSVRTKLWYRKRSIKKNLLEINKVLHKRVNHKREEVRKVTETITRKVEITAAEGQKVLRNAKQKFWRLKRNGKKVKQSDQKLIQNLEEQLQLANTIIDQSRKATAGIRIPNRICQYL